MSDKHEFPRTVIHRRLRPEKDREVPNHIEFDKMGYVRHDIYDKLLKEVAELSCPNEEIYVKVFEHITATAGVK